MTTRDQLIEKQTRELVLSNGTTIHKSFSRAFWWFVDSKCAIAHWVEQDDLIWWN